MYASEVTDKELYIGTPLLKRLTSLFQQRRPSFELGCRVLAAPLAPLKDRDKPAHVGRVGPGVVTCSFMGRYFIFSPAGIS